MTSEISTQNLDAFLDYLKRSRGVDLTGYKRPSLVRRIQKRMQTIQVDNYLDYTDFLEVYPDEFIHLFDTILINVTSFFRDGAPWDFIAREVIPQLAALRKSNGSIRVWTAGCSTGEETYSIAMLLKETLGDDQFADRVKIYATDIDDEALSIARAGAYPEKEILAVPPALREKYFDRMGKNFVFKKDIRRMVIFGRHNLVQDAPISKIDLLICRNLLMYLNADTQSRVLSRFQFALNPDGFLFLGKAEMLLTRSNMFTPVDLKMRIFTRVAKPTVSVRMMTTDQTGNDEAVNTLIGQVRLRDAAFDASPIPQIVVAANGNLVLANNRARYQFGLSQQAIGSPFRDTQLSYRPADLRSAIDEVIERQTQVRLTNVEWIFGDAESHYLDILITPLQTDGVGDVSVHVMFQDLTDQVHLKEKLERANLALETAIEELQSTNEELETTNEELQSTNEELETTNEELQSTNEELETMNEELQSTNEELETLNDELQVRTEDINRMNVMLENIMASIKGGVVVLDSNQCVLTWNHNSETMWGLRADEVYGQNFFNLDIGLPVAELKPAIRAVAGGKKAEDSIVLQAVNRRGRQIQCQVTCTPILGPAMAIRGCLLVIEEAAEASTSGE